MADFIRICCSRPTVPDANQIAEFVAEGTYFEKEPPLNVVYRSGAGTPAWSRIEIRYEDSKRPVVVTCQSQQTTLFQAEVTEIEQALNEASSGEIETVENHLRSTVSLVAIEINSHGIPEDAWEMIDALESFIASAAGGIIYVDGEGFYDAQLQVIVHF